VASEFVAGVGVQDATAQEGGAEYEIKNVEHDGFSLISSKAAAYS